MNTYIIIGSFVTIIHILRDIVSDELPVREISDFCVAFGVLFGYAILVMLWPWQIISFIYGFIQEVRKGS